MTVKVLGAGSVSGDSIGILGDPFSDAAADAAANSAVITGQNADQDVDELELLEFLAADLDPVPADPAFRHRLSDLLWDMVRDGRVTRPRSH
jgi:hypothetical protein